MSGDDTARALGAAGGLTTTIAGKECTARPLSARELAEVERICIEDYKDNYLATVGRNIKRLPDKSRRNAMMEEQLIKMAEWTIKDLPKSEVFDPDRINITRDLRVWLKETFSLNGDDNSQALKNMVASSLNQGMLSKDEYKKLTNKNAPAVNVPYVNWWITGCYEGMITFVWVAFRDNGVTKDEVATAVGQDASLLTQLTQEIDTLSAPAAGNG